MGVLSKGVLSMELLSWGGGCPRVFLSVPLAEDSRGVAFPEKRVFFHI